MKMKMRQCLLVSFLTLAASAIAQIGTTDRVSIGWPLPPNGETARIAISQTGLYIVYESLADNIVGRDLNGARDIFFCDWTSGVTEIVSITGSGVSSNGDSYRADVSANGRFVVFQSAATNLVPGDTNGVSDIFVRDRQTETTFRVSVSTGGVQGNGASSSPVISDQGSYVAFISTATNLVAGDTNNEEDVFLYNLETGATTRVSVTNGGAQSNGGASDAAINSSGNRIAFSSTATNLVAGDTNAVTDVFLRDTQASTTILLSRSTAGVIGNGLSRSPSINAAGDRVAFRSSATNLVTGDTNGLDDVFRRSTADSTTVRASVSATGVQGNAQAVGASIHSFADIVAFSSTASNLVVGDTNAVSDVFQKNLGSGAITRMSVSSADVQGNGSSGSPAIGNDYTVFLSDANNLVEGDTNSVGDGFIRSSIISQTFRVTNTGFDADTESFSYSMSNTGRYVAFSSRASNLVEGDTNVESDVFRLDLFSFHMTRVSEPNGGGQSNGFSSDPSITADGTYVAFTSEASNLVSGDTNGTSDIFVRNAQSNSLGRVSVSTAGAQGNGNSFAPVISADGRYVAFVSSSTNLVVGDTNARDDIFVRDRQTSQTFRVSVNNVGQQGNGSSSTPAISDDGSFVAFGSLSTNLVTGDTNAVNDIFVRNVVAGTTERVSVATAGTQAGSLSGHCSISGNGERVAFMSSATNLVAGDTNAEDDIFVRDRVANTTIRVSVSNTGLQSNGDSWYPSISADGQSVGFQSRATNLVVGDINGEFDCFVRSLTRNATRMVSVSSAGEQGGEQSQRIAISSDGLVCVFDSPSFNLVPHDRNEYQDVFLNDSRIKADSFTLIRGVGESGGLTSVFFPDDIHRTIRPGITFTTAQTPIEIVTESTGPLLNPTRLEFGIEFSSTSPSIRQTIELYNFDSSVYELVDTRQSTVTDAVAVVAITSNVGRFVSPTGLMRARISYKASGPVFAYPWRTHIDHVRWTQFN